MYSREKFGKDHWSLLLYVETCVVDGDGVIDTRRMRTWGTHGKHNTILAGGELAIEGHDDWACLAELVDEKMVDLLGRTRVKLTDEG